MRCTEAKTGDPPGCFKSSDRVPSFAHHSCVMIEALNQLSMKNRRQVRKETVYDKRTQRHRLSYGAVYSQPASGAQCMHAEAEEQSIATQSPASS